MTSLLTNSAAMVALQTLSQIGKSLDTASNRVSTGLRISEASDSAAYWAIATTTDSDNSALATVGDALALGKSTLDVVYNGLDSNRKSLQKIKDLLLAARQPGVNRVNVQTEITGLITDMVNKASASVINEQNFLAVDSSATTYNATKSIVASFERSSAGIAISTIDLTITSIVMTDAHATSASKIGILDKERGVAVTTGGGVALAADTTYSVLDVNIAALTDNADSLQRLGQIIELVDTALTETIAAQNTVGVNLARAESQEAFISALMDANKSAIGALIDANMEEESTRLRALQTQQQLSIESLSIANTSAQNILTLFR